MKSEVRLLALLTVYGNRLCTTRFARHWCVACIYTCTQAHARMYAHTPKSICLSLFCMCFYLRWPWSYRGTYKQLFTTEKCLHSTVPAVLSGAICTRNLFSVHFFINIASESDDKILFILCTEFCNISYYSTVIWLVSLSKKFSNEIII